MENSESGAEGEQEVSIAVGASGKGGGATRHIVEMRLIIKQARITVPPDQAEESQNTVRVEFTHRGKSLSTSQKPVDTASGLCEIKQSFNQKISERFDKQRNAWDADLVELSLFEGEDLVGVCRFDVTRFIDKGARTEKICMVAPEDEVDPAQLVMKGN